MARKLEKSKRKEEGYRRSPRICDAWKAHRPRRVALTSATLKMECDYSSTTQDAQGPASRTRSRKKRKLRPLQEVASTSASPTLKRGSEKSRHEDHQANGDQGAVQDKESTKNEKRDSWTSGPSKPWLPVKRRLELILDILQRRDTHEIFAEPVDPEEVEDYYEIIKEPMDFGTMRAKLHEGMYQSFEQFEHDVFLITKNAMHFNSSATIYFRQARAINELATKVFRVLKTHPESFELEFSDLRRRNGRRQGEAGNSVYRTRPKIARNVKSSSVVIDESSKPMSCSLSASSNIRRSMPVRNECYGFDTHLDANNHKVPFGAGDDGRSGYTEKYRRSTYEPSMSFLDENESIFLTISGNEKQLELVIHQDISYEESLLLFARDLGPVVQMIARRKLLGCFPAQKSQFSMTSSTSHQESSARESVFMAPICQNSLNQVHWYPSVVPNSRDKMELEGDSRGEKTNMGDKVGTTWLKVQGGSDTTNPSVCLSHKLHQNQSSETQLCPSGYFSSSFAGFKNPSNASTTMVDNTEARNSELAFEHSNFNSTKLGLKNTDMSNFSHFEVSTSKLSPWYPGEDNHGRAEQGSCEAGRAMTSDRCKTSTSTSQFIFNLPYLRARLGRTNSLGQDTFLQQHCGSEVTL